MIRGSNRIFGDRELAAVRASSLKPVNSPVSHAGKPGLLAPEYSERVLPLQSRASGSGQARRANWGGTAGACSRP